MNDIAEVVQPKEQCLARSSRVRSIDFQRLENGSYTTSVGGMVFEAANDTTNRYTEIAYFPESRQSEGVPQVVVIGPDAFRRQAAQALNAVPQRPQTSDIEKALRTVVGQELDVNKAAGMVIVVSAQEGGGRLRYDVIGKNQPGFRVFHHREGVAVPTRWDPPDVRGITQVSLGSPVQLDVRARDTRNPFALSIKPKY